MLDLIHRRLSIPARVLIVAALFLSPAIVMTFGAVADYRQSAALPRNAHAASQDQTRDALASNPGLRREGSGLEAANSRTDLMTAQSHAAEARLAASLAALVAFLLAAAALTRDIARKLSERLGALGVAMDRLARGEDVPEIPCAADENETGQIARALAALRASFEARGALIAGRERVQAEAEQQFARLAEALNNIPQGVAMFGRDGRLIVCNVVYRQMYRLSERLSRPGARFTDVLDHRVASGMHPRQELTRFVEEYRQAVSEREPWTRLHELADGRAIAVTHTPLADGATLSTHFDITERRALDARTSYLATHDALTGLDNRAQFCETLRLTLEAPAAPDRRLAVFAIDLDRFKEVNDTGGHAAGDLLLRQVADRLLDAAGQGGVVARFGGDEFAVLRSFAASDGAIEEVARAIVLAMRDPFDVDGFRACVGASVGIAVAPHDGATSDELLQHADLALYRAKTSGRSAYQFYEPTMGDARRARWALENDLKIAIGEGQFELYYQPLLNLDRDQVDGFEALIRWNRPGHGVVSPDAFIPLAEETRLIIEIGEWVLREACARAAQWPSHVGIAVNVSPIQFKSARFVSSVKHALAASKLDPRRLEIEVTETAVMSDEDDALAILTELNALGVRLALDDFGTGYSSLTSLRRYPFDRVKIDRSFIRDICNADKGALEIVRSVATLGLNLGKATTAEGVETVHQLAQVLDLGCTEIQGYLISAPRPAAEVPRMLLARSRNLTSVA